MSDSHNAESEPRPETAGQDQPAAGAQAETGRNFERAAQSPLATILHHPPALIARGLLYIVVLLIVTLFVWAAFSRITDIVEAPAQLVPDGRLALVETTVRGMVRDIPVREGDHVSAGQPLIILQSEDVSTLLSTLRASAVALAEAKRDVRSIVPTRIASIRKRISMEKAEASARERIHQLALEEIRLERERLEGQPESRDRNMRLRSLELRQGRIENEIRVNSRALEAQVSELAAATEDLMTRAERALDRAQIDYDRMKSVTFLTLRGVDPEFLNAAAAGESRSTNLAVITAPISGVVTELAIQSRGQLVDRGANVVKIIPANVGLVAELKIPGHEIGKVREGQEIRFKFDAFPFSEHGVLRGHVEQIRPRATIDPITGATWYLARSRLNRDFFMVQGEESPLLPGMTAVAEISTDRHSILSILFRPVISLAEPSAEDFSASDAVRPIRSQPGAGKTAPDPSAAADSAGTSQPRPQEEQPDWPDHPAFSNPAYPGGGPR